MSKNIGQKYDEFLTHRYGIKPMSLDEELALPEPVRKTRNNKCMMMDDLYGMTRTVENLLSYIRRIPEENDPSHSELVDEYRKKLHTAKAALDEAHRAYFK